MLPDVASRMDTASLLIGRYAPLLHTVRHAYTFGAKGINDTSEGLFSYVWHAFISDDKTTIYLEQYKSLSGGAISPNREVLYTGAEITEVSVAFDQNARPVVAFVEGGEVKMRYYDGLSSAYVVDTYADSYSPRVALDGRHDASIGSRDIILSYIYKTALVQRTQREAYRNMNVVYDGVGDGWFLRHAGMGEFGNFQWALFRRECYESETGEKYPPRGK